MAKDTPLFPELPTTGYIRLPQVLSLIPVGRSTWWQGIKDGRYPKGIKLGPKTTAWKVEDIRWLLKELNKQSEGE